MAENHAHQLKRKSISDQIFDILKEKIISNQWKPGDKIPSETELAASFGVSRLSARTAIQRLSALGLVEIRVGDGTYIKDYPLDNLLTEGSELLLSVREEDEMGAAPRALYRRFGFREGKLFEELGYPAQEFVLQPGERFRN